MPDTPDSAVCTALTSIAIRSGVPRQRYLAMPDEAEHTDSVIGGFRQIQTRQTCPTIWTFQISTLDPDSYRKSGSLID